MTPDQVEDLCYRLGRAISLSVISATSSERVEDQAIAAMDNAWKELASRINKYNQHKLNPLLVDLAKEIVEDYTGWLDDQNDPPSLRGGFVHPGKSALRMARMVLSEDQK